MSRFAFSMFCSFNPPQDNNSNEAADRTAVIGLTPMDFLTFNRELWNRGKPESNKNENKVEGSDLDKINEEIDVEMERDDVEMKDDDAAKQRDKKDEGSEHESEDESEDEAQGSDSDAEESDVNGLLLKSVTGKNVKETVITSEMTTSITKLMKKTGHHQVKAVKEAKFGGKDRADIAIGNVKTGAVLGLVEIGIETNANKKTMQKSEALDKQFYEKIGQACSYIDQIRNNNDTVTYTHGKSQTKKGRPAKRNKKWTWKDPVLLAVVNLCRLTNDEKSSATPGDQTASSKMNESGKERKSVEDKETESGNETGHTDIAGGRLAIFVCERKENSKDWRLALLYRREQLDSCKEFSRVFGYYMNALAFMSTSDKEKLLNLNSRPWEYLGPNTTKVLTSFKTVSTPESQQMPVHRRLSVLKHLTNVVHHVGPRRKGTS